MTPSIISIIGLIGALAVCGQRLRRLAASNAALKRDLDATNAALAVAHQRLSRFGPKPRGKCGRFVARAA